MLRTKYINWTKLFEQQSDRYLKVYDNTTGEIIEVHDKKNGNIWDRIDYYRWMLR